MNLEIERLDRLVSSSTYREIVLRSREYLAYSLRLSQREASDCHARDLEQFEIAEAAWFNCLLAFLMVLGMTREKAEHFCEQPDCLTELALRIQSII